MSPRLSLVVAALVFCAIMAFVFWTGVGGDA